MFKIGDEVRLLQNYGQFKVGDLLDVIKARRLNYDYSEYGQKATHMLTLQHKNGIKTACYAFRVELVPKSFNVSTATDQELADEYRRVYEESCDLHKAMKKRGYKISTFGNNNVPVFSKTETISI